MNNQAVQRTLSCGFNAGYGRFNRMHNCGPTHLRSASVHNYPLACPPPKIITIDRVVSIAGIDNALFFVGDVEGYRMNRNYNMEIPGDAVGMVSGNFPSYLLLKDGNMHTLGFSTGYIETFLRENRHMFSRNGVINATVDLMPEFAPQDMSVEGMGNDHCKPERDFRFRIVNNTTLNDASTTIEVTVFECDVLIDREIWYIIPVRCENCNTVFGANLAAWDVSPRTCGEAVFIPGRATDNGQFVIANFPSCGCGRHRHHGR